MQVCVAECGGERDYAANSQVVRALTYNVGNLAIITAVLPDFKAETQTKARSSTPQVCDYQAVCRGGER